MDDATRNLIAAAVREQPQPTVTVLSSLLAVEDAIGYIPKEAVETVAERNGRHRQRRLGCGHFLPQFPL